MMDTDMERAAHLLDTIEQDLRALRQILNVQEAHGGGEPAYYNAAQDSSEQAIEGIFDGERMVDESGKGYQVSANYASKSKLVEGDPLKLYITSDGKFFYKQLGPVARKTIAGVLRSQGNQYVVEAEDGHTYSILTASVTYYMSLYNVRPDDKVMIMIPAEGQATWAVIDNTL